MVELAWLWQRYQPATARPKACAPTPPPSPSAPGVRWCRRARETSGRGWFVTEGVVPEGAVMKPGRGQGRVAPGRALPTGRLHRDQPDPTQQARGQVLQRPRHRRATHQGGQDALLWTRLSCHAFRHMRCGSSSTPWPTTSPIPAHAGPAAGGQHWSLTTLREKLVKIGARIVRHGRYVATLDQLSFLRYRRGGGPPGRLRVRATEDPESRFDRLAVQEGAGWLVSLQQ